MNFNVTAMLCDRANTLFEGKKLDDTIGFSVGFCGGKPSNFADFLPLVFALTRAQGDKSPCITKGICIFGRYNGRNSSIGGGF
jgi:hypothetical protein